MQDVILVTADSVRRDFVDSMSFVSIRDVMTGVAAGHYTRPSLAALQSSKLQAAVQSKVIGHTLAEAFGDAGYTTIGLVPTPQADPAFDFDRGFDRYDNYMSGGGNAVENRRSRLREYLGSFDLVRQVYRRVYPMEANMDDLPDDGAVITEAIERFNAADGPRFLWVHLMGTHRPYGTGSEAVPTEIDRTAEAAGGRHWFGSSSVSDDDREIILGKYRNALGRTDSQISRLLESIEADDPVFAFTSDHGDEFGEEGYYYHQGYRRRVPDPIVEVPVVFDGFDVEADWCSLFDIAPTLAGAMGVAVPDSWDGTDLTTERTETAITVAPWHDKATVAWRDRERTLVASDADVSYHMDGDTVGIESADISEDVESQLRDLGYTDAG